MKFVTIIKWTLALTFTILLPYIIMAMVAGLLSFLTSWTFHEIIEDVLVYIFTLIGLAYWMSGVWIIMAQSIVTGEDMPW